MSTRQKSLTTPFLILQLLKNVLLFSHLGSRLSWASSSSSLPLPQPGNTAPRAHTLPQQCFYQLTPQEHRCKSSIISAALQAGNLPAPGTNIIHSLASRRRRALENLLMQPQRPPAMAAQYHLEKTSITDLSLQPFLIYPSSPLEIAATGGARREGALVLCHGVTSWSSLRESLLHSRVADSHIAQLSAVITGLRSGYFCPDWVEIGLQLPSLANKMPLLTSAIRLEK